MAYFILGIVVGLVIGILGTQRVHQVREGRSATAAGPPRPVGDPAEEPLPITKKAAKLGIRPEDLTPSDDILVRMQRAWERGVTLDELDELEAAERESGASTGPGPGGAAAPVPDPGVRHGLPSASTVTEALDLLSREGYDEDLHLGADGLSCSSCGTDHPTDLVEVDRVFRFEGPSDPADEAIVLGLRCPACGAKGSLVSAFGPDADPALADAFVYLARQAGHG
jgi:hypothetical protein